jgi:hypothetical protein
MRWLLVLTIVLAGLATGCSGGGKAVTLAPVSGTVTLAGRPLTAGHVTFESAEGFAGSAPLDASGAFQMRCQHGDGMPVGQYRVSISPPSRDPLDPTAPKQPPATIPFKYHIATTSGLEAEVRPGGGPYQFDLIP